MQAKPTNEQMKSELTKLLVASARQPEAAFKDPNATDLQRDRIETRVEVLQMCCVKVAECIDRDRPSACSKDVEVLYQGQKLVAQMEAARAGDPWWPEPCCAAGERAVLEIWHVRHGSWCGSGSVWHVRCSDGSACESWRDGAGVAPVCQPACVPTSCQADAGATGSRVLL